MSRQNKKIVKYRRPLNFNIGMLIFAVILIYVIICVVMYFRTDQVMGYEVTEGSLSGDTVYRGIALRQEKIITSTDAGYINYYAREGERTAVGDLVYTIDETGRLSDYLQTTETGENSLTDADLSELKSDIETFANGFDKNEFSDIYSFKYNMQSTALKLANYNILENAGALNDSSVSSLVNFHYAPDSGILIYSIDGYEDLTLQDMKAEYFDKQDYSKEYLTSNTLVASGDPVYKLSTSEDWSVVIQVDEDMAQKLEEEVYVEVRFLKNQYTAWGEVSTYQNEDGDYFAALTFTNSMITFCTERYIDIELILEEEKGLKIPNSAIAEKEFFLIPKEYITQGGNDDDWGVLLESYDEDGNVTVTFVETDLYEETDDDYYVDDSVLRSGSCLIKPDSTDKYVVSRTATLIGVYNINKGYADFTRIQILYQNDDYAIVKSNTTYGLSEYDYIALDASTVEDNQFIYE